MAIGYWIVKGDKTSCDGSVLEGTVRKQFAGKNAALNGHKVSCGKHPGVYHIAGGHPGDIVDGKTVASTLYSRSTCPCKAHFIPSQTWAWHGLYQDGASKVTTSAISLASEPEQHAQLARKNPVTSRQEQYTQKEKREITLTVGVFFDGTGNNAINTDNMFQACTAKNYNLTDVDAGAILGKCARENFGVSGTGATSYTGYYTNVHWLRTLYKKVFFAHSQEIQKEIYIDGVGTEAGKADSMIGQGLGISDTGVIAKTNKAVSVIAENIQVALKDFSREISGYELIVTSLQFDIFGFSRGAAAARHFANRIHSEDPAIIRAIKNGIGEITFNGAPAGKIRFIGIFDTVAAIGTPANGLNPHSADAGSVNLRLRPGVADKVFHITAAHECRFNFALNSVKPAWPELALPGVHSDIGGGYLPVVQENLFLTRPQTDTVPLKQPGEQTRGYHQTLKQAALLDSYSSVAPIARTSKVLAETWYDERMPPDRYGEPQKRSYAAITLRDRIVKNDWSKVAMRVMLNAAQEAGVMFDEIQEDDGFNLPCELAPLCEKAIAMGKAVRSGQSPGEFSEDEIDIIASSNIHCSANWNAIVADVNGFTKGGASASAVIGFLERPDENWRRTVYNMDGKKV